MTNSTLSDQFVIHTTWTPENAFRLAQQTGRPVVDCGGYTWHPCWWVS